MARAATPAWSFSRGHRSLLRPAAPVVRAVFEGVGFFITAFEVAWSDRGHHAVFLGQRNDGRMFTVSPRAPHQATEWSWDTDDIAEI